MFNSFFISLISQFVMDREAWRWGHKESDRISDWTGKLNPILKILYLEFLDFVSRFYFQKSNMLFSLNNSGYCVDGSLQLTLT